MLCLQSLGAVQSPPFAPRGGGGGDDDVAMASNMMMSTLMHVVALVWAGA